MNYEWIILGVAIAAICLIIIKLLNKDKSPREQLKFWIKIIKGKTK